MPHISIIIPVYNCEKYLDECIRSILAQTYQDFEILLVNDGSTDNSAAICNSYSTNPRIRIFHKPNGGASSARNLGLENARGQYIMFIDGDDFILPSMLQTLIEIARRSNADIIGSRLNSFPVPKKQIYSNKEIKFNQISILSALFTFNIDCSPCTKLFRHSIIGNTRFIEGVTNEDIIFLYDIYSKTNNIIYFDTAFYQYRMNPNSVTHIFGEHYYDLYKNMLYLEQITSNDSQAIKDAFHVYKCKVCLDTAFYTIINKCKKAHIDIYTYCREYSLTYFNFILHSKYISLKYLIKLLFIGLIK